MQLGEALLKAVSALLLTAAIAAPAQAQSAGQEPGSPQTQDSTSAPSSSYQALTIEEVRFPQLPEADQKRLRDVSLEKAGQPLDRQRIRETIQALYASGRFADIRAEVERTAGGKVLLTFVTSPNYFVGDVTVEGTPIHPSANQVASASKLQLGELFTSAKLDRAVSNIKQVLQENGYYLATLAVEQNKHPDIQQMDLVLRITPGAQARVGQVIVNGHPGYSQGQIQGIARMHGGDAVSVQRVGNALERLRKKYQKQDRLLAQVSITDRIYRKEVNAVDYTFNIEPGPKVDVVVEGFGISKGTLKRNVPVYEENALDDDLLNEGRRNLLNYLQGRGYFDAKVELKRHSDSADELRVIYSIDEGSRHKLVKVNINGSLVDNQGFPEDELRSRMQVQPAGRLFSNGRYSQSLLNSDIRTLEALYRSNGFQQVKIGSRVEDDYEGQNDHLLATIQVDPGPLTLVNSLRVTGNNRVTTEQLGYLNIDVGQAFSEAKVSDDREIVLNHYFNNGFPNATFEASATPVAGQSNRVDVTYTISEGEQLFVNQVLVSGLNHTRSNIVQRELRVKAGDPVSQSKMLNTQQSLYDLGIFSQVDTAVQNPEGLEREKNVLVDVQETKRYTFNYGVGLEFQTGQPAVGTNQPQGETGVSPRVSFAVTRLNLFGRNHTVAFKTHVGRLQQRALLSYDAPRWFNSENWRLSLTTFYDNTLDVTTFTSERLEGSIQAQQTISKPTTMFYRFTYRRVRASNIEISQDQIPLLSQPTRVGMPGFSYIRNKRDNDLETTKGNYTTVDGGVASGYFGSEADFGRILIQNSTYHAFGKNRPAGKKFVFARSTRIGVESPFGDTLILAPGEPVVAGTTAIPLPERFFSGGGNSHRGFGLNQAGPRDPSTGFPLGGAGLFLNNLELRFPPATLPFFQDNLSFAVFHDAGNVFTDGHDMLHNLLRWRQKDSELCMQQSTAIQCDYNYISHAIGVGVRYKTPIGPVRFDFGYNLNPPRFPSTQPFTAPSGKELSVFIPQQARHFNVYFSIGQTF